MNTEHIDTMDYINPRYQREYGDHSDSGSGYSLSFGKTPSLPTLSEAAAVDLGRSIFENNSSTQRLNGTRSGKRGKLHCSVHQWFTGGILVISGLCLLMSIAALSITMKASPNADLKKISELVTSLTHNNHSLSEVKQKLDHLEIENHLLKIKLESSVNELKVKQTELGMANHELNISQHNLTELLKSYHPNHRGKFEINTPLGSLIIIGTLL